jgi:hypothetical protein
MWGFWDGFRVVARNDKVESPLSKGDTPPLAGRGVRIGLSFFGEEDAGGDDGEGEQIDGSERFVEPEVGEGNGEEV